jgi:apolipoprotein N-acyltransferase
LKRYHLYLLALLSGLLLGLSWFPHGLLPLIFLAWVPLLIMEDAVCRSEQFRSRIVFYAGYLAFFTWNLVTTWWLVNASWGGAAMAIIFNSLIMATFFYAAHTVKKRIGKWGNVILVLSWLGFEFIHLNWSLSWSWLTLGNSFADSPSLIQWYEYTGVAGGSLWVLLVNFLLFGVFKKYKAGIRNFISSGIILAALLILPPVFSFLLSSKKNTAPVRVLKTVILQPNVDPYHEKFVLGYREQLEKMLEQAAKAVDSTTDYLVFPETALTESIWEEEFDKSESLQMLHAFLSNYPRLTIVTGATTFKSYGQYEEPSETAKKFTQDPGYYDEYNTALQLDHSGKIQVYHKSKLVQGVETMPLQFIFKHFESVALDMGGTTSSLGTQKERSLLYSADSSVKVAPVVCYESIFGEYVTGYVKKGANLITIITNDGWWGETPGYMQHLRYGRLRAIENRRWIVRSANTGTSCFIDPQGNILQPAGYWVPAVLTGQVELHSELTFYTKYGDYIGRTAFFSALILLIYSWLIRFRIVKK